ncbi:MAG: alkyl hydroperoxide reductase [Egibacteraceae bacterium]
MLAAVERRLAGEPVVVIGVHSPKFPTEGDARMVRQAVRRHGVTHPVVVDTEFRVWRAYAVRAWPTLVLVSPDGMILGASSGEPDRGPLYTVLWETLREHRDRLISSPLPLRPEPAPPGALAFPGGIAVAEEPVSAGPAEGSRVYVADTGHHQIVACAEDGREITRLGSGRPGLRDGPPGTAQLHHPHGLAVHQGRLYAADTGNHAVRTVDLLTGAVYTLAGTGQRGRGSSDSGPALRVSLRSPWDIAVAPDGAVIVAMAGSHQLWAIADAGEAIARVLAGSGREARIDGEYTKSAFAQPSGLTWGPDGALYVADSEISAVRRVAEGMVETIAGGDLLDFGDIDGIGDEARLQHPVGITRGPDGGLLVADTLNHKVKHLDTCTRDLRTLLGDGAPLHASIAELEERPTLPRDARASAWCQEPEALVWDGQRLLVADTGNQRILAVDLASGAVRIWLG